MPTMPSVDLWERPSGSYVAPDLEADTGAGHNVVATVFVECGAAYDPAAPAHLAPVGESALVAEHAARCATTGGSRIAAIVSFDMMLGEVVGVDDRPLGVDRLLDPPRQPVEAEQIHAGEPEADLGTVNPGRVMVYVWRSMGDLGR